MTMRVAGTPKRRWFQNERLYPITFARRACSLTIRFAADPTSVKFPATVLTQANISHAFVTLTPAVAAADAATLGPSNNTAHFNMF